MTQKVVPIHGAAARVDRTTPSVDIEHVLEVSVRQFAELGYDGVSMREISRECGCPAPSIYYHFASKSELYREAYSNKVEQTIDLMSSRLAQVTEPARRFEALIEAFHDLFTGDRELLLLMQRDVIDAAVTRRRFLSQRQYDHFISLIQHTASESRGIAVSRDTAFTIGALVFGYCELSLMMHELQDQHGEELLHRERIRLVRAATALIGLP